MGFNLGVLKREAFAWKGRSAPGAYRFDPKTDAKARMCIQSEIGWIKLGDLEIAAIPGEIYPELALGKVQDPA